MIRILRKLFKAKPEPQKKKPTIFTPTQVLYRLSRIFSRDNNLDPGMPYANGAMAKCISEEYEKDYNKCVGTCKMILEDEQKIRDIIRKEHDEND